MKRSESIADRLERYRLERHWTYQQIAAAVGIDASTINKICNRKSTPSRLTMRKLCDRLPGLEEVA